MPLRSKRRFSEFLYEPPCNQEYASCLERGLDDEAERDLDDEAAPVSVVHGSGGGAGAQGDVGDSFRPFGPQTPDALFALQAEPANRLLLGMLDQQLRQGVRLAAPLRLAMLLADVALILAGRVAPQLRVDDQALAARNLVFFVFLPLYCAFLVFYVRQDLASLPQTLAKLGAMLPGAVP